MTHGDVINRSNYFFSKKGSKTNRTKAFFHGISPPHTMYIW